MSFAEIHALRPQCIFDVVPREVFIERNDPGWNFIGAGNYYEWKYAVAEWLQPRSILEIGVRYGYSLATFVAASRSVEKAVGWDNGCYKQDWLEKAAVALNRVCSCAQLHRIDSQKQTTLGGDFDLVHIDSSHSFEGCLHDLNMCHGHAKAVLIDDTNTCPDDRRAVRKFCEDNPMRIRDLIEIPSHVGDTLILLH